MLEHPGASILELARLVGLSSHSSIYYSIRALQRRKLVTREKHYQRCWSAIGTLAMHAEIETCALAANT